MLYKLVTLSVGTEERDDEASRMLSRYAKQGFVLSKINYLQTSAGTTAHAVLQRVPIQHLPSEAGDPPGLRRIQLGTDKFYWDPCGDEEE